MSQYPAKIDNTLTLPIVSNLANNIDAGTINALRQAIINIQSALGANPAGSYSTLKGRLEAIESSLNSFGNLVGDATGSIYNNLVVKIYGRPLSPSAPTLNQVLSWNGSVWAPQSLLYGSLDGYPVDAPNPGNGYVLTYDSISGSWKDVPSSASWTAGGDLSGNSISQNVIKIRGQSVSSTTPVDGYVLTWDQAGTNWVGKSPNASPVGSASGDLSGSYPSPTVAKLQGRNVNTAIPTDNYVLTWDQTNGYWTPKASSSGGSASGDLSGSYPSPVVVKLQGRSVNSIAPTDGYSLVWSQVDGYWRPVAVNATGSASGDLSGSYPSPTVVKLQNRNINSAAPTDGYVLTWDQAGTNWIGKIAAPAGPASGDLIGSYPAPSVLSLTGSSGSLNIASTAASLNWAVLTTSPTLKQLDITTNSVNGQALTIQAQNATGTSTVGGKLSLKSGTGTSSAGNIELNVGATLIATASTSKFSTNQGRRVNTYITTNNLTVVDGYDVIVVGAISGSITIIMPASPSNGDLYTIKDQLGNAATKNIIINGNGNNIDGNITYTINANYESVNLIYANSSWSII